MVGVPRGSVELEPFQAEWRRSYEREVERLEPIVGDRVLEFEHVGSTAVEGLAAKPIVDVLALVADREDAAALRPVLEDAGYEFRPTDDVPDRSFFAKGPRSERTHYLSVTERGSDCHLESVAFRDYLREHPAVAAEYEALKRDLADRYPENRAADTDAKSEFVAAVLERALE